MTASTVLYGMSLLALAVHLAALAYYSRSVALVGSSLVRSGLKTRVVPEPDEYAPPMCRSAAGKWSAAALLLFILGIAPACAPPLTAVALQVGIPVVGAANPPAFVDDMSILLLFGYTSVAPGIIVVLIARDRRRRSVTAATNTAQPEIGGDAANNTLADDARAHRTTPTPQPVR